MICKLPKPVQLAPFDVEVASLCLDDYTFTVSLREEASHLSKKADFDFLCNLVLLVMAQSL